MDFFFFGVGSVVERDVVDEGALPADDGDGATQRDTMHFRVDADVLVPCGGRPGTIHAGNARDFLKPGDDGAPGAPRAPPPGPRDAPQRHAVY